MPDFFYLCRKWWKSMLTVTLAAIVLAVIILMLLPPRFLAVATALPANPAAIDRGTVFEKDVLSWYSAWGTPDDLDRIVGTGQLDTAYLAVADSFNLAEHYRVKEKGAAGLMKAAFLLKKNSKVVKSEYGELKVKVWNTDHQLAPNLANALLNELAAIHQHLQNETNIAIRDGLRTGLAKLQDSIMFTRYLPDSKPIDADRLTALTAQLQQYQTLLGQYQLMIDNNPPALRIVERARPAITSDRLKPVFVIIAAGLLGFLFALLTALVLERKK